MKLKFIPLDYGVYRGRVPGGKNIVFLNPNNWDDFGFKTQFAVTWCDFNASEHYLGEIKIAFENQSSGWTAHSFPKEFESLPPNFYSLGLDVEYYEKLSKLPPEICRNITGSLHDVVADPDFLNRIKDDKAFQTSLTRGVSFTSISEQFRRTLGGGAPQTPYNFIYKVQADAETAGLELRFDVSPDSKPSTNIHVLIGRNGIGKTTLLNGMISAIVKGHKLERGAGNFWNVSQIPFSLIEDKYFSSLVSVSFSAFDPFTPPLDSEDHSNDLKYFYVGLKKVVRENNVLKSEHKDIEKFSVEFASSLSSCFSQPQKKHRWIRAIRFLESDENFAEMDLTRFAEEDGTVRLNELKFKLFKKMSSGHAVVLLTMTKLVEKVDEKTLVLMDEPESHLHPPLLSAFTRALSDLLTNRNAVCIIATHSPVVLQEVPRRCVWKLRRTKLNANADRPESETFGENVGVLTREVFQLEVQKSGFHDLLNRDVNEGKSFDEILNDYDGQIGLEGKAVLRSLIATRGY
ncbi:AAA family ATPase [Janthinobacterium sp. SUN100]|uniref:AAA family ATPase n=1 Tax=Janthinobacterium sp. SUN100 TaxID=3004101 RepID=UPI0025B025BE|nr:AAA family ATPase [Janthinobacterium sp. SUN100]MDN2705035.1 AAA family ATPase [Janthinobacterium sp. SUN100]